MFEQFGSIPGLRAQPQPETGGMLGWDAGVEFTLVKDRAFLDVTYFRANLTDEIGSAFRHHASSTSTA